MTSRDRQERERRAMEEEIVTTALTMVRQEGAANLSLRRVAEHMEYSSAALYRYFPDKAALVQTLAQRGFTELASRLRHVPTEGPAAARLIALGEAYLHFAVDEPHLYTLMFVDVLPGQPVNGHQLGPEHLRASEAFTLLHNAVADGAMSGSFRLSAAEVMPATLAAWALVHGYAMLRARYLGVLSSATVRAGLEALASGLSR